MSEAEVVERQARRLEEEEATSVKQHLASFSVLVVLVVDQALVLQVLPLLALAMQRVLDVPAEVRNYLFVDLFCLLGMVQVVPLVSLLPPRPLPGLAVEGFVAGPATEVRPIRFCLV